MSFLWPTFTISIRRTSAFDGELASCEVIGSIVVVRQVDPPFFSPALNKEDIHLRVITMVLLTSLAIANANAQPFRPEIPKVWDDSMVADFQLPLATPDATPRMVSSAY